MVCAMDAIAAQRWKMFSSTTSPCRATTIRVEGGWFWWGCERSEPFGNLAAAHQRLTVYHGLHNLDLGAHGGRPGGIPA